MRNEPITSNVWQVNTLAQRVRFFGWPRLTFLYKIYLDGDIRRCPFWRERFERTRSVIYCLIERVLIWQALVSLQKTRLGLNHLPSGCGHGFGMWKKSCLWKIRGLLRCLMNVSHNIRGIQKLKESYSIKERTWNERQGRRWLENDTSWVDNVWRHRTRVREGIFTKTKAKFFQKSDTK